MKNNNQLLFVALVGMVAVVGLIILFNTVDTGAATYGRTGETFCPPCPEGTIPRAYFMSGGMPVCSCVTPIGDRASPFDY